MWCPNCGRGIPDDVRFCRYCGIDLSEMEAEKDDEEEKVTESEEMETEETVFEAVEEDKKSFLRNRKKLIIVAAAAVIIAAAVITAIFLYTNGKTSENYDAKIKVADKYLKEEEFEKAEKAYLEAIEIAPKKSEAYTKVCDMYVSQQRYEEAETILIKAEENAGGKEISEKLEKVETYGVYNDYINETIIPEEGLADVGEQTSEYNIDTGLVSAFMRDTDGDESPELITVSYIEDFSYVDILFSLYDYVDGEVVLLDDVEIEYDRDVLYQACEWDIFMKETDEKQYLIIGFELLDFDTLVWEMDVYEVNSRIKENCSVQYYASGQGDSDYTVNGVLVSSKEEEGLNEFGKAMSKYGIDIERYTYPNENTKYGVNMRLLEYDENEGNETHLAHIQYGAKFDDGSVDFEGTDLRYIEDYTGIRE